jgi:ATP-dependent protease HslVU (ClpYQ) peptidase subunit
MSCTIAYKDGGKVYMGCDSAVTFDSDTVYNQVEPVKIFRRGDFLVSTSSSLRFGQILRDNFKFPSLSDREDVVHYMTSRFVNRLIEVLDEKKFLHTVDGEARGYAFIVGVRGRIFIVCSDFSVLEIGEKFAVVGSGEKYAEGAMAAIDGLEGMTPKEKIEVALGVAEHYCSSVRSPFHVFE